MPVDEKYVESLEARVTELSEENLYLRQIIWRAKAVLVEVTEI